MSTASATPTERVDRRRQQAVVGADEQMPVVGGADGDGPSRPADPGIDDREVDADRRVGSGVAEHGGALTDVVTPDSVGQVDHLGARRDAGDHGTADAGEVVGDPVVGEEGDRQSHGAFLAPTLTGAARRSATGWVVVPGPGGLGGGKVSYTDLATEMTPRRSSAREPEGDRYPAFIRPAAGCGLPGWPVNWTGIRGSYG